MYGCCIKINSKFPRWRVPYEGSYVDALRILRNSEIVHSYVQLLPTLCLSSTIVPSYVNKRPHEFLRTVRTLRKARSDPCFRDMKVYPSMPLPLPLLDWVV